MTVRIITDSTCDLPAGIIARLDIAVVPLYIHVGNREFLDGIDLTDAGLDLKQANAGGVRHGFFVEKSHDTISGQR